VRQHHVCRKTCHRRIGMEPVVDEEAGPQEEEGHPGRNAHSDADPGRLARLMQTRRGDIALDHVLVAGVFGGESDESEQGDHPEGPFVEIEPGRAETEFMVLHADPDHFGESSLHRKQDRPDAEHATQQQNDGLDHIGPDDRLDAAEDGVETDDHPADRDHAGERKIQHSRHRERNQIQHRRQPDQLQNEETD